MDNNILDIKKLQEELEKNFLNILINHLNENKLTVKKAKEATKIFLFIFETSKSFSEIKAKIEGLVKDYPEFKDIKITIKGYEEEQKTKELLEKMRSFLKEGKIDEVSNLANQKNG